MQLTSKEQHNFTDLKRQQQSLAAAGIQHGEMVPSLVASMIGTWLYKLLLTMNSPPMQRLEQKLLYQSFILVGVCNKAFSKFNA